MPPTWVIVIAGWYALASLVTLTTFWLDKRAARRGSWRMRERTLHLMELAGGWPGSLIAQWVIRHKNRKPWYQVVFWLIVTTHGIGWFLWFRWMA